MKNLAQSIPAKVRTFIYSALGAIAGLAAAVKIPLIADQLPAGAVDTVNGVVATILAVATALGFTVAVANVPSSKPAA